MKNKKIIKTAADIIETFADSDVYGWPPQCGSLLYQPVRPDCMIKSEYDFYNNHTDSYSN